MGEYRYRENAKRGMAFVLAIILGGMAFLPGFPVFPVKAAPASGQQTTLTTAHGDTLLGHKLYCIAEQSGTEICILGDALAQSSAGG